MGKSVLFGDIEFKNPLIASSSPLTETAKKIRCCKEAGFGGIILKTAAQYQRNGGGYGRKVVFIGEDYYADASYEREILTLEEGVELYKRANTYSENMLVIPSVSANSMETADWLHICQEFENLGAKLVQLDFFYLGMLIQGQDKLFYRHLGDLLSGLQKELNCIIMPKLNFNFDPECVCRTLAECGVRQVSLLDSIRFALPKRFGLHSETTSYFGRKQLPLTLDYLRCAVKYGLEVCAGGGVACVEDVDALMQNGATLVQTASYVLKNGFALAPVLLHRKPILMKESMRTWCDVKHYGETGCEKCNFCLGREKE